jgi:hypothetical protein
VDHHKRSADDGEQVLQHKRVGGIAIAETGASASSTLANGTMVVDGESLRGARDPDGAAAGVGLEVHLQEGGELQSEDAHCALPSELGRRAGPEIHVRALGCRIVVRADPAPSVPAK